MFNSYDKELICKEGKRFIAGIQRVHKIKESSWSRVYHVFAADQMYFCKAGPLFSGVTNEYEVLMFLKAKGIRFIPEVVGYWEKKGSAFFITRFIRVSGDYDSRKIGENFAQVHSFKHKKNNCYDFAVRLIAIIANELADLEYWWGKSVHRSFDLLREAGQLLDKTKLLCEKEKALFTAERQRFLHMDTEDAVIPCNGEMFIVDWHLSGHGDPAWDLARLCAYERQYSPEKFDQQSFFKGYGGSAQPKERLARRMAIYRILSDLMLLLYSFGDSANLVRYRASPLVVSVHERKALGTALDRKILHSLQGISQDMERLSSS